MLLHCDCAILYSLSDCIVFNVLVITIFYIIYLVSFAKLSHESIQRKSYGSVGWCLHSNGMQKIDWLTGRKYTIVCPSSPIENKLHCVVLLRFAKYISSALQKLIETKCKLHNETHDTLSEICTLKAVQNR